MAASRRRRDIPPFLMGNAGQNTIKIQCNHLGGLEANLHFSGKNYAFPSGKGYDFFAKWEKTEQKLKREGKMYGRMKNYACNFNINVRY